MAVADGQPPQESSLSPHASNDAAAAAAAREREAAVTLQRFARRFVARKRFSRLRAVALRLQRWRRQRVARRALGRHGGADFGGSKAAFAQGGGRSRKALAFTVSRNVLVAAVWFACSAALSIFNRGLVGSHRGAFPAPLLMTALQFLYQYLLAAGVLRLTACAGQRPHRELGWEEFLSGVAPTGVCTGIDIGASNLALVYITVSFYTMCKSSSPAFLLLFAFLARVEKPNWALAGIIATICLGVVLTVAGETQFHLGGFVLVMSASAMSGARWVLMQKMVARQDLGITTPLASLVMLMPVMAVTVLVASIVIERPWSAFGGSWYTSSMSNFVETLLLVGVGAVLAFIMTSAEFKLVCDTSAVTVTVAGVCKEVFTIMVSMGVYGDELTPVNVLGLVVVIFGVACFSRWKLERYERGELSKSAGSAGGDAVTSHVASGMADNTFVLEDDGETEDVEAPMLGHGKARHAIHSNY